MRKLLAILALCLPLGLLTACEQEEPAEGVIEEDAAMQDEGVFEDDTALGEDEGVFQEDEAGLQEDEGVIEEE